MKTYQPNEADWLINKLETLSNNDGTIVIKDRAAAFNFQNKDYIDLGFVDDSGDIVEIKRYKIINKTFASLTCKEEVTK